MEAHRASRIVKVHRLAPEVHLFDVSLGDYHEFFFVVSGERSVTVTSYDGGDVTHGEAQVFVFARPYGWDLNTVDDDDALIAVWEAVGVQR